MAGFAGDPGGRVDLFATGSHDNGWSFSWSLRPIIEKRGKMAVFSPFLDYIDHVRNARRSISGTFTYVAKGISAGKSRKEIESELNHRREQALSMPLVDSPIGVGSREGIEVAFDVSSRDWLRAQYFDGSKFRDILHLVTEQNNAELLHWALSMASTHAENHGNERDDGYSFVRRASKAIVESCNPLFALKELLCFCTGPDGPPKYRGNEEILMCDILNTHGKPVDGANGAKGESEGKGGILGDIFSHIFHVSTSLSYDRKLANEVKTKAVIEEMYAIATWLLKQPTSSALLSSRESRARLVSNLFGDDASFSISDGSCQWPHEIFRIFRFLISHRCDLNCDCGGTNLVVRLFEWYGKHGNCFRLKGAVEIVELFGSSDEYRDAEGNQITSTSHVVRWLALHVGISLQHLKYQDLTSGRFTLNNCLSEDDFKTLKEEQQQISLSSRA